METILEYPEKCTEYINNNFGGKDFFISLNSLIKSKTFQTTHRIVVFGSNGWMFFNGPDMISLYSNPKPYTEIDLRQIALIQMERKEWLKLQGMDYYLFIPPVAQSIYPEFLPNTLTKCYPLTKREQVIKYLEEHTDIKIIKIDEFFFQKKKKHDLYYKTDTHWNFHAGFYAYQYIIDYFKNIYPNIPTQLSGGDYNLIVKEHKIGDLLTLLNRPQIEHYLDTLYDLKTTCSEFINDPYMGPLKNSIYIQRAINTKDTTLPDILMYRDSYAGFITKFFPCHFNKIVLLWENNFLPSFTKKENCDIVLFEIAEHLSLALNKENPLELKEELKRNGIKIELY